MKSNQNKSFVETSRWLQSNSFKFYFVICPNVELKLNSIYLTRANQVGRSGLMVARLSIIWAYFWGDACPSGPGFSRRLSLFFYCRLKFCFIAAAFGVSLNRPIADAPLEVNALLRFSRLTSLVLRLFCTHSALSLPRTIAELRAWRTCE